MKDVPGYFTADPRVEADARPLASIDYDRALAMADDGCELVQREALETARTCGLPIVVRGMAQRNGTVVHAGARRIHQQIPRA